ncbi:MAG TPA: hypothetical protein PLN21_18310 [Gemmatales bacterium]|nr:hypothetical protein [Gemmatales bacterium]
MLKTLIVYGATGLVLSPIIVGVVFIGAFYLAEWEEQNPNWDNVWRWSSAMLCRLGPISAVIGLIGGILGGYETFRENPAGSESKGINVQKK